MAKVKPLTNTQIKKAKPQDKEYKLADGDGLYLHIMPTGSKLWRFRYTLYKKVGLLSLGKYPAVSLKMAREYREKCREMVAKGIKPTLRSNSITFSQLVDKYFEFKDDLSPKYIKNNTAYLKNYYYPTLEHIGVDDIESSHIKTILIFMSHKKEIHETARRTAGLINRIFRFGVTMDYMQRNPMADIDVSLIVKRPPVKNFAHITDIKVFKQLLEDIDNYDGDFYTKSALQLMPYVFLRPSNIRFAKWEEIDLDKKIWEIPANKMKMKKSHIVPLSDTVLKIIENVKGSGSEYLFPSSWNIHKPMSENTLNMALKRLGYKDIMTSHGFRHTASTILHENIQKHGIRSDIIEMQLAHTDKNSIRGVYNKALYLQERQELMNWWSDWLDHLKEKS